MLLANIISFHAITFTFRLAYIWICIANLTESTIASPPNTQTDHNFPFITTFIVDGKIRLVSIRVIMNAVIERSNCMIKLVLMPSMQLLPRLKHGKICQCPAWGLQKSMFHEAHFHPYLHTNKLAEFIATNIQESCHQDNRTEKWDLPTGGKMTANTNLQMSLQVNGMFSVSYAKLLKTKKKSRLNPSSHSYVYYRIGCTESYKATPNYCTHRKQFQTEFQVCTCSLD